MMTRTTILLLAGLLLCGCLGRGGAVARRDSTAPLGKVPIYYAYTEGDRAAPPAGFVIMRSAFASGPFSPVHGTTIAPQARWRPGDRQLLTVDAGLILGSTHYYFVEKVLADGRRSKATAVTPAVVSLPLLPEDRPLLARAAEARASDKAAGRKLPSPAKSK